MCYFYCLGKEIKATQGATVGEVSKKTDEIAEKTELNGSK